MPTNSARTQTITFTGDTTATQTNAAANNPNSPGQNELKNLAAGANVITAPTGGATPVAVTIVPPAGNTAALTLKGVAGDTGVLLHLTDPCTLSLGAGVVSFVLNAAAAVTGLRLIWS
jgi:hypothetical protein